MAETFVAVTAGSGTKLHSFDRTIGANTVHDEVVVNGEQYLASYVTSALNCTVSASTQHMFQVMAGASLKVRIRRIEIEQHVYAAATEVTDLYVVRLTTAGTGGTGDTPVALDSTDTGPGAAARFNIVTPGTQGATMWRGGLQYVSSGLLPPPIIIDYDLPRMKPLIIPAGTSNGITIRIGTAQVDATALFGIRVYLDESNF